MVRQIDVHRFVIIYCSGHRLASYEVVIGSCSESSKDVSQIKYASFVEHAQRSEFALDGDLKPNIFCGESSFQDW